MTKPKERSPAMQFYFRQFSGDENVAAMDLDAVGAHILLMCYAGASPDGYRVPNNDRILRNIFRNPNPDNFTRIKAQLLDSWKPSSDGKWLVQAGMKRILLKQKEFSKVQRERVKSRWGDTERVPEGVPEGIPDGYSSSSSSSTYISSDTKVSSDILAAVEKPEPKIEIRPMVFLSRTEFESLEKAIPIPGELAYWANEVSNYALENPKLFNKKYKNHYRVILRWRQMKLEKGFVWDILKNMYQYASRVQKQSTGEKQIRAGLDLVSSLREQEGDDEKK